MPTTEHTERLDVEDEAERELRLGQLLERINDTTSNNNNHRSGSTRPSASSINVPIEFVRGDVPSSSTSLLTSSRTAFDFGVRETHAVEPPRELLARLDSFLPQMEAANAELGRRMGGEPPRAVVEIRELGEEGEDDDEEGDAEEEQYIEMNLGLGVFDIRRRPTSGHAGTSASSSSDSDSDSDSEDTDSSSADDDSHSGSASDSASDSDASHPVIPGTGPPPHRPIRSLPIRSSPRIIAER